MRTRLYVCGRRVHHGAVGAVAAAVGLALAIHDIRDRREWFRPDRLTGPIRWVRWHSRR